MLHVLHCVTQLFLFFFFRYAHVRIDPVHYCELEIELAEKRKRGSFFNRRNADPIDVPELRLHLFMRSVRESPDLGNMVLSLRTPYMTRQANKTELARTVSVLPNLRFVDLPTGVYTDDPSCHVLKRELMARCPDIRRMSYHRGSEGSFSRLPSSQLWKNLEVLELSGLQVETRVLRPALNSFPNLRDLTLEDLPGFDDSAFTTNPSLPPFPAVQNLILRDTPNVTASGLAGFFSLPVTRKRLRHLTLSSTGILPESLYQILTSAPNLRELSFIQEISRPFPVDPIPPLTSKSLDLLHYEITSSDNTNSNTININNGVNGIPDLTKPYYTYLISSLLSNSLPALRDLYVRDPDFPETLLLAPPPPLLPQSQLQPPPQSQLSMGGILTHPLNVYSKGLDELEWNFTPYDPPSSRPLRDPTTRPVSWHSARLSASWTGGGGGGLGGGEARKSVLVGNGFGGFLAVPVYDHGRPGSSSGSVSGSVSVNGSRRSSAAWKRESRQDLWR